MLTELTIRDFAIIDELTLRLDAGFTVLTGETGAGKSIIIDAVDLLLGGRSDSTAVRAGSQKAIVEGTFRLDPMAQARLNPLLEENGLEGEPADILRANFAFRAVALERGTHAITLLYNPASLKLGLIISAAALAVCVAVTLSLLRTRR